MNAATFVDHASEMLGHMLVNEAHGPGDTDNAMRRLETRYGIPFTTIWACRYRKPKQIAAHVYAQIATAYDCHCAIQERKFAAERDATKAKGMFAAALVRAADALAGEEGRGE